MPPPWIIMINIVAVGEKAAGKPNKVFLCLVPCKCLSPISAIMEKVIAFWSYSRMGQLMSTKSVI